jgi:hypothetical protein
VTTAERLTRTIEDLDGNRWPEPTNPPTSLVTDVYRLRRVPIGQLTDGDLRLLLGQRVGVQWLIPFALDRLTEGPLSGDWLPGDLLGAVLHAGIDYWDAHPGELMRLWEVRQSLEALGRDLEKSLANPDWPAFG